MSTPPTRQRTWGVALAAGLVAASVYAIGDVPLSNIDDYNVRPFAGSYWGALGDLVGEDAAQGRVRPLYWALEGALGAWTGSTGMVLHAGRLAFLVATTALFVLLAARLGSGLILAAVLGLASGWSLPAQEVWGRGGPAEAFAQPLALASILLVLTTRRELPGILMAAGMGLASCLVKESYAPWTAAVLLAHATWGVLAGKRGSVLWAALLGAGVQFLPAVLAWSVLRTWSGSYAEHVIVAIRAPPASAALAAASTVPFAVGLATLGLLAIAVMLARSSPRAWALEDLVVIAGALAVALETLALGFVIDRYFLPLGAALLLVAARGVSWLHHLPSGRRMEALAVAASLPVVIAGAARAFYDVRARAVEAQVDERFRGQVADALVKSGAVRIFWVPADVERPIGAVKHLAAEGITGDVQLTPCSRAPAGMEEILGKLFAPYAQPLDGLAPVIVSTSCPGADVPARDILCVLQLPSVDGPKAGRYCVRIPEKAIVLGGHK